MARAKISTSDRPRKEVSLPRGGQPTTYNKREENSEGRKRTEPKAYIPQDNPLTLSQMQHVAPKKFKTVRQKPQVNLEEVRKLIRESRSEE